MSDNPTQPKNVEQAAFFTRAKANEGIKLPLSLPDGSDTDHWIQIRGVDSDVFRAADSAARREALEMIDIVDKAELERRVNDGALRLLGSLVIAWSFPMECTIDNIVTFLREAPQIGEQINRIAARRSVFFKNGLGNSSTSPAASSS